MGNGIVAEVDDVTSGAREGEEDDSALPSSFLATELVAEFCGRGDGAGGMLEDEVGEAAAVVIVVVVVVGVVVRGRGWCNGRTICSNERCEEGGGGGR